MDGDTEHGERFDLRQASLPGFYPADDVLAEMGRVAIAATRVDSQLALLLLAVKYPRARESRVPRRTPHMANEPAGSAGAECTEAPVRGPHAGRGASGR
jgi:hypothetical protein